MRARRTCTHCGFSEIFSQWLHARDESYESFARTGESMTTVEMAAYAFEQIDRARAELT
jgi:hypothetical protein